MKNNKDKYIQIRVTEEHKDNIVKYCIDNDITVSAFLVRAAKYVMQIEDWKVVGTFGGKS